MVIYKSGDLIVYDYNPQLAGTLEFYLCTDSVHSPHKPFLSGTKHTHVAPDTAFYHISSL